MMAMDIHKTRFEAVEICGVPALFTVERVRRSELPNGIYAYDMQTSGEDWSQPCLLACHITVEHYGTVLTASVLTCRKVDTATWPQTISAGQVPQTGRPSRSLPSGTACR